MNPSKRRELHPKQTQTPSRTIQRTNASKNESIIQESNGYTFRPYEPEDRDGFLSLHETVFGGGDPEWFTWKYDDNPYLETPIFVATKNGDLVGARPYLGFRMRAGDNTYIAIQTADTMVHRDHRRQGLFGTMTEQSLKYYAHRDPVFSFNVPNAISRPGYLKLGWTVLAELPTWYRIQNPAAFASFGSLADKAISITKPIAQNYYKLRDNVKTIPEDVTVVKHPEIPTKTLASLYRRVPPDAIHALRDEEFYEYRFENPEWDYTTYTARLGDTPVAGIITGTQKTDQQTITTLVDVVPLVNDAERDHALVPLLARILRDHQDGDIVACRGSAIPGSLLSTFGFKSDQSFPLSHLATPTVAIVAPIPTDSDWRIAGRALNDPANWAPTFVEQNTR